MELIEIEKRLLDLEKKIDNTISKDDVIEIIERYLGIDNEEKHF